MPDNELSPMDFYEALPLVYLPEFLDASCLCSWACASIVGPKIPFWSTGSEDRLGPVRVYSSSQKLLNVQIFIRSSTDAPTQKKTPILNTWSSWGPRRAGAASRSGDLRHPLGLKSSFARTASVWYLQRRRLYIWLGPACGR